MYDNIWLPRQWPMLWLDGQEFKRYTIGKLVTIKFGEEACGYTSLSRQKNMKGFFFQCKCSQWVTSAEQDLNQIDKMSLSVHPSQPLSLVTLFIAQWALEQCVHGRVMEIMHELSSMDLLQKG